MSYTGSAFIFLVLTLIFIILAGLRNISLKALKKAGKENVNYINHIVTKHSRVGMLSSIFFVIHLVLVAKVTYIAGVVLAFMILSGLFASLFYEKGEKYLKAHQISAGLSLIAIAIYFFV